MGADMFLGHEVTRIERRGNVTVLKTPKGEIQAKSRRDLRRPLQRQARPA